MNRIRWYGPTIVLIVVTLIVMLAGPGLVRHIAWAEQDTRIRLVQNQLEEDVSLHKLSNSFRKVAEVVEPSVVHIERYSKVRRQPMGFGPRGPQGPMNPQDLFRRWFNDPNAPQQEQEQQQPSESYQEFDVPQRDGNGSGWVYDHDGHIITNFHVVNGADRLVARFADGSERDATVVGADPKTDVAVIKVEGGSLHPARIAGEQVEKGDIVFAFGSPLQFEFTMSQGIVSAKGRRLDIINQGYENFIQTDAAINPGNSGGPLTNIYGHVIGMNTAIASRTGVYNGLGFAIPVKMVQSVAQQIIEEGKVSRGYLGIAIAELDPRIARSFGFKGNGGVLVRFPMEGTPAETAGIKRGDIITAIDGTPVRNVDDLRSTVANLPPGTPVEVEIYRQTGPTEGKAMTITVELAELPEQVAMQGDVAPQQAPTSDDADEANTELLKKLGLEDVVKMDEMVARQRSLEFTPGVLVLNVRPTSVAFTEGIRRGSIITHVMGKEVSSVGELVQELSSHKLSEGVRISVVERGNPRFVFLEADGMN